MLRRYISRPEQAVGWCLAFILGGFLFYYARYVIDVAVINGPTVTMPDIAYHLLMAKAFWFDQIVDIYQLDAQLAVLSNFSGRPIHAAMPIGASPVAFLLWYPFAILSSFDLSLGYSSWVAFSAVVFVLAVWQIFIAQNDSPGSSRGEYGVGLLLVLCSYICVQALLLGQTSLVACAIFVFVVAHGKRLPGGSINWPLVLCLIVLSVKPTYFVIGLATYLCCGLKRESAIGTLVVLVIVGIFAQVYGLHWLTGYFHSLNIYSQPEVIPEYRGSIVPETMILFRTAFGSIMPEAQASHVGLFIWLASTVLIIVLAPKFPERILCCALLIGSFLLFAPYVGAYEDLLLIVLIASIKPWRERTLASQVGLIVFLAFIFLIFNREVMFGRNLSPLLLWGFKLYLVSYACLRGANVVRYPRV